MLNEQQILNKSYDDSEQAIKIVSPEGISSFRVLTNPRAVSLSSNPTEISLNSDTKVLWVSNPSSNSGKIYIGIDNSITAAGNNLDIGEEILEYPVAGLSSIFVHAENTGDSLYIQEFGA